MLSFLVPLTSLLIITSLNDVSETLMSKLYVGFLALTFAVFMGDYMGWYILEFWYLAGLVLTNILLSFMLIYDMEILPYNDVEMPLMIGVLLAGSFLAFMLGRGVAKK